jgi:hypothetical protein
MDGEHKQDQDGCPDVKGAEAEARKLFEGTLEFCRQDDSKYQRFETNLFKKLFTLARALVLVYLLSRKRRLPVHYDEHKYRVGEVYAERKLQTVFGEVSYGRLHLKRRQGGGCGYHPLDVALGLTRDGFSPNAISFLARLTTRMSYDSVRVICQQAWGWAPSTETLHALVLGLGRYASAYVEAGQWWKRKKQRKHADGEVLVIEADGKCPPTATAEELEKRRGPRRPCPYCCQRHRGQQQRKKRGPKKRRRKGDKSKNGREAMVVVMYTLRRGADGLLHGPINKKVWGTFAGRRAAAQWARREATRRGFPPSRNRDVQVLIDGAKGLEQNLRRFFDGAIFTLDVRHVEERIWTAGRAFHREGSKELAAWVQERRQLLYERKPSAFLAWLEAEQQRLAGQRGSKGRIQALQKLVDYLRPRLHMLNYAMLKRKDLVLATGQVEGAVRYVVAQRFDCAGMRWIVENAESLLQLRCLEVNGDWHDFFAWTMRENEKKLCRGEKVLIRTKTQTPPAIAA